VRARIAALDAQSLAESPVEHALRLLREVLPVDAARRAEGEVWLALTAAGLTDPTLQEIRAGADAGIAELCTRLVVGMQAVGALRAGRDAAVEAARLHAVVDGISMRLLLTSDAD